MKQLFQNGTATSVWRHRDLRIVAPARALSVFGDEVALVALMLHVHDQGGGARGITALLMCAALPTLAFAPWAGRMSDRLDSRHLVVWSGLLQAGVCAALAATGPLWTTYLLVIGLQAGQSVAGPTWQALVPRIVGEADTGRAIGALQALSTLAAVAGPPVGGLLFAWGGRSLPLLVDAVTFALLAAAGFVVRTRRGGRWSPLPAAGRAAPRALDGVRVVRRDQLLWPIFMALMAYIVVGEATNAVEVLLVRDTLAGTTTQYGLVGAAAAAGIVVGSLLGGRLTGTSGRVVGTVVAAAVQSVALLSAGLVPTVLALMTVYAVLGVANGALNTSTSTLVMTRVPDEVRGQVGAAINGMARGFSILALALGGLLGTLAGPSATFVCAGAASLLVVGWLALRVLPLRSTPTPTFPPVSPLCAGQAASTAAEPAWPAESGSTGGSGVGVRGR